MAHYVEIRYSNDGGNNWSNWRLLDKGDTGKFLTQLKTRRLGFCEHRIWEIRDTSSVASAILSMAYCIDDNEDWQEVPLPDGTYSDADRPWADQDVVNQLPTPAEASGTRSPAKYPPVPGLQAFANVGDGPHRGGRDVEGKLFIVSGNKLFQVLPSGVATELGTIPGTGLVSMTHNQIANGNQLVIGTGNNSYVYSTVTGVLAANGVPLLSVDFLNQLVLGVDQARRFWRYSGLADATSWNTLDNESAESSPDRIVGGIVSQGEWLVFGERTIEPWSNNGGQDTAFTRNTGAISERGCINANTIKRLDNTVFFVDNNFIPCRMQGYQPVPIAPKAIVDELSRCDPTKLLAYTWEDRGYVVYYITAQDGRTWGYDVTSQKWHRRESFGLDRWRLNTLFKWNGDWYGGDYTNGKLYRLTWGYVYEGCEIMPRRIRSGALHNNGNRVFVNAVKLTMQTGGTESVTNDAVPTISGSASGSYTVGDAVSYQYTLTPGYPGQAITLTVDGTLPSGLTLSASGLLSGVLTASGTFAWSITPSTDCGTSATLDDSASVAAVVFPASRKTWASTPSVGAYGVFEILGSNAKAIGNAATGVTIACLVDLAGNGKVPFLMLSTGTGNTALRAALRTVSDSDRRLVAEGRRLDADTAATATTSADYTDTWALAVAVFDYSAGTITLHVNGASAGTGTMTAGTSSATDSLVVGFHQRGDGVGFTPIRGSDYAVFRGALAQADIDKMFGYYAEIWNLRSHLPVGHPYKTASVNGWNPNAAGARIWYYADNAANTFPAAGTISTLNDKSGHGNDATRYGSDDNNLVYVDPLTPLG